MFGIVSQIGSAETEWLLPQTLRYRRHFLLQHPLQKLREIRTAVENALDFHSDPPTRRFSRPMGDDPEQHGIGYIESHQVAGR